MADVDYGYGDDAPPADNQDYGYGDSAADYGYGDQGGDSGDYGYGDQGGYGYGDQGDNYGYGDQGGGAAEYGYGDNPSSEDLGYGVAEPDEDEFAATEKPKAAPAVEPKKRTKRRCSVTRFSMEAEACDKPLDYGWNGTDQQTEPGMVKEQPHPDQQQVKSSAPASDDKSAAVTAVTTASENVEQQDGDHDPDEEGDEGGPMIAMIKARDLKPHGKKGMLSKIRKRLSIAF